MKGSAGRSLAEIGARGKRGKKLADIISIESPAAFRESIRKLKRMGIGATEKRALLLAQNRAKAMLKKRSLSDEIRTRRFSRAEYERLIDLGVFQPGEEIELIGGELMVAEPQGAAHYSLAADRRRKGSLYARAGLADYWVLNLMDRVLEVYREPAPDSAAPFA